MDGGDRRVPKLPPVNPARPEQRIGEYCTLRFTRQQPSARFKNWDARKTHLPVADFASTLPISPPLSPPSPAGPLSARGPRPSRALRQPDGGAYPLSARGPAREDGPASLGSAASQRLSGPSVELFQIDQEELSAFRLITRLLLY